MNIQQLEADLNARIMGLEDEESKLRRELECLRRLPLIAAEWDFDLTAALRAQQDETLLDPLETSRPERADATQDPFDSLRRKLAQNPEVKRPSVFNSRTLLAANA